MRRLATSRGACDVGRREPSVAGRGGSTHRRGGGRDRPHRHGGARGPAHAAFLGSRSRAPPAATGSGWDGDTKLEGDGSIGGSLVVTPTATTGGALCVSLPTSTAVAEIGRIEVDGQAVTCGPDDHALEIPARFVANGEANASDTGTISYSSTYTPSDGDATQELGRGDGVASRSSSSPRSPMPAGGLPSRCCWRSCPACCRRSRCGS